jgi:hypothetical protein
MSRFDQPSREQLEAFRDGDPVAIDEVIALALPQVTRWAIKVYKDVVESETASVVNQVFAEISFQPQRYDPDKSFFTTYAINLIKLRMKDKRQSEYNLYHFEGIGLDERENDGDGTYNNIEHQIDVNRLFETVAAQCNELEREFLMLMREGEKHLDVFIEVLNRHYVALKPDREVNTIKERIRRRLTSVAHEMGLDYDHI